MTTAIKPCNCHSASKGTTETNERPRYYARQLVTPDDMTLEQDYFREKARRHNRMLHGWGVVCGATVIQSNQPWMVIVRSGYVLGPYGDEIYIETDQCVDVRVSCTPPAPGGNGCQPAQPAQTATTTQWIAVKYVEKQTGLVRVPVGGCGCEDSACEYSRYRDSYLICVLDHCPTPNAQPPEFTRGGGPPPDCPPCPAEPWVVLASFTVDANGNVTIQQCDCRRQVLSFGSYWWACTPANTDKTTQPPADTTKHTADVTKPK